MQESKVWLSTYGERHADLQFRAVYWISALALVPATTGMLWSLPVPAAFVQISPVLNWGSAFLMAAVVYYFIISLALAIGVLPFIVAIAVGQAWVTGHSAAAAQWAVALFVSSLLGLAAGRNGNGGVRAVLEDIQMMIIAPIWLLAKLYKRAGIPY